MAATKQQQQQSKSSPRKLPPGWEKRIDYATNKPYYVDHKTKTTQWNPPTPKQPKTALPALPSNNIINKHPVNPFSSTSNPNTTNKRKKRTANHGRASTFGSSTFPFNINEELKSMDINNTAIPSKSSALSSLTPITNQPSMTSNGGITQSVSPRSISRPLRRKPSKPYSNTTDTLYEFQLRRMSLKPVPPPDHLKKSPSIRNTIPIKPPIYTKKNMAATFIPPPPPRSIPSPPSDPRPISTPKHPPSNESTPGHDPSSETRAFPSFPPIQTATNFCMMSNAVPKTPKKSLTPTFHPPHRGALPSAKPITPTHVESIKHGANGNNIYNNMPLSAPIITPTPTGSNCSFDGNNNNYSGPNTPTVTLNDINYDTMNNNNDESHSLPMMMHGYAKSGPATQFYRNKNNRDSQEDNRNEKSMSDPSNNFMDIDIGSDDTAIYKLTASTPDASKKWQKMQGRTHSRTTTTPVFTSKWGSKSPHLSVGKLSAYKEKLAKKYDKKKKKLKESIKEKKAKIKDKRHKKKQKEDDGMLDVDDMSITMTSQSGSHSMTDDIEYSVSMTNPLAPNLAIKPFDFNQDGEQEKEEKEEEEEVKEDIIEFYTLHEIVELVTSPEVRGTQDQTVLLYTYCLYSSRQELLSVILDRLSATSSNNKGQIKVLSLLRTWLKTEHDFIDCEEDDFCLDSSLTEIDITSYDVNLSVNISNNNNMIKDENKNENENKSNHNSPHSGNSSPRSFINLQKLSPNPSVPDPPLTKYEQNTSAASIDDHHYDDNKENNNNNNNNNNNGNGLDIINDDEEINRFESDVFDYLDQPQLTRHKIQYSDGSALPPFVKLSPFAAYFRKELIENTKNNDMLIRLAKPILTQLSTDKRDSTNNRDRTLSFADAPNPKIPKIKSSKDIDLNKLSATEVARQICLSEYDIFKKIKPEEFLKQKSTKQKKLDQQKEKIKNNSSHNLNSLQLTSKIEELKKQKSNERRQESSQPNIDKMTDWFNRLVVWTQIEILYQRDSNKRCKALSSLLKICAALEKYNNISSLCAIRAGLCSAPIHRLRKTWDNIPKKSKEIKAKIDELFKLGNGQKNLRDRVAIISQPAIPHLGLFLGDIVFIHDGNDTFKKQEDGTEKINWSKMKLLADRINWISMFQQSPFIFQTVPIITEYLQSKMKIIPEDFLYKLSREVEPPENKKKI